jgi:hypothetical protein
MFSGQVCIRGRNAPQPHSPQHSEMLDADFLYLGFYNTALLGKERIPFIAFLFHSRGVSGVFPVKSLH